MSKIVYTKSVCDRCGKEEILKDGSRMKSVEINVNGVELANWRRKSNFKDRNKVEELADLCDTCFTSLKNWWKEKKGSFR